MTGLILLMVFSATALTAYALLAPSAQVALVQQRAMRFRRSGFIKTEDGRLIDEEMELPFTQRVLGPVRERFSQWLLRRTPGRVQEAMQLKLTQAGNPMTASQLLGMQATAAAGAALGALLLFASLLTEKPVLAALVILIVAMVGWRLPDFLLARRITARRRLIDRALPDVLDLLSVSVEAGLGLDGAFQKVGEKFAEPTAGEFRELLKTIRLGTPRTDALRALAERTGLADVRTFTAAVIQAEQLGVSITRVLRAQSDSVRQRRRQKVEERAMALPVKMLFPLILFIFPCIFIAILGPVVIGFLTNMSR